MIEITLLHGGLLIFVFLVGEVLVAFSILKSKLEILHISFAFAALRAHYLPWKLIIIPRLLGHRVFVRWQPVELVHREGKLCWCVKS